jgi:hypothetical protein
VSLLALGSRHRRSRWVALPFVLVSRCHSRWCRRLCLCVTVHTSIASRSTPALRRRLRSCRVVVCTLVSRRSRSYHVVTCAGVASSQSVCTVRVGLSGLVAGPWAGTLRLVVVEIVVEVVTHQKLQRLHHQYGCRGYQLCTGNYQTNNKHGKCISLSQAILIHFLYFKHARCVPTKYLLMSTHKERTETIKKWPRLRLGQQNDHFDAKSAENRHASQTVIVRPQ